MKNVNMKTGAHLLHLCVVLTRVNWDLKRQFYNEKQNKKNQTSHQSHLSLRQCFWIQKIPNPANCSI